MRAALKVGALVAARHNSALQTFHQRLLASGKTKKVRLAAVTHMLQLILNAMVKRDQTWEPEYVHNTPKSA